MSELTEFTKALKFSAIVNAILGSIAVLALILLYLALSDIAEDSSNSSLEWYIAGISMIILSVFTISFFVTIVYALKYSRRNKNVT